MELILTYRRNEEFDGFVNFKSWDIFGMKLKE